MVDDQAHLAKVADAVGAAVTVVMLLLSFVADADLLKDWPFACFDSFLVPFLKTRGKGVDPQLLGSKLHPFVASERPYVGELQLLVEKAILGEPRTGWVYQLSKVTGKSSAGCSATQSLSIASASVSLLL